ncbi:BrnT family toxin [uncultured Mailhella sp.]|uniref:BrnT family toxin n=1 Tax=uncultured Mailhella sp. TaxID=1981031 RepID=UPI00262E8741|nr:BrnT family toxin [uncultured Mailhella sp.]
MAVGDRLVQFSLGDMLFEYDEEKNRRNIEKHGISFVTAARIFFDYDRIEMFDDEHSQEEDRYNTIGDTSAGNLTVIGNLGGFSDGLNDILFVVYTERETVSREGETVEVTRLISARLATSFERGLYYGKYS